MDNISGYSHAIPVNGGNFVHSVAQMSTSMSATQPTPSLITYLDSANRMHPHAASHWPVQANRPHATPNHINHTDNNNLAGQHDGRADVAKTYPPPPPTTIIADDESGERITTTNLMENFLEHKGSENVKRFSVNNLLQLANNCRAISHEHRSTVGEFGFFPFFCFFVGRKKQATSVIVQ